MQFLPMNAYNKWWGRKRWPPGIDTNTPVKVAVAIAFAAGYDAALKALRKTEADR